MGLPENIGKLHTWANSSRILLWDLEDDIDDRTLTTYDKSVHGGMGYIVVSLRAVLYDLIESMQWFVYGHSSSFDYVYWQMVHQGLYDMAKPVTWKAICEAWLKDDFAGRAPTIAIIDRMRQILWDEPFNITWAARPEDKAL